MAKAKKGTAKKATKSNVAAVRVAEPDVAESDRALAASMTRANALAPGDVQTVAIGANLALHNARIGVASVLAEKKTLSTQLRAFDEAAVNDVVTLALAYGSASRRVDRSGTGEVARLYAKLAPLRAMALASCESLALGGFVPAAEVARMRAGRGKIDGAQDGIDLAAFMLKHWSKISSKTSITKDDLATLDETGRALLALLKPKAGRSEASDAVKAALDLRNRVGTLLLAAWRNLWKLGALAVGYDAIDESVPPLQSVSGSGRKPAKPAPTPAAPAT